MLSSTYVFLLVYFLSCTTCELRCVCVFFRHWEAIKKWDEAIHLSPEDPVLYEMKSQVHYITFLCVPALLKVLFIYYIWKVYIFPPQTPPHWCQFWKFLVDVDIFFLLLQAKQASRLSKPLFRPSARPWVKAFNPLTHTASAALNVQARLKCDAVWQLPAESQKCSFTSGFNDIRWEFCFENFFGGLL